MTTGLTLALRADSSFAILELISARAQHDRRDGRSCWTKAVNVFTNPVLHVSVEDLVNVPSGPHESCGEEGQPKPLETGFRAAELGDASDGGELPEPMLGPVKSLLANHVWRDDLN